MQLEQLTNYFTKNPILFFLILAWVMIWKGMALWRSSQKSELVWFIVFLLVHTFGILEIIYIFLISKDKKKEVLGSAQ